MGELLLITDDPRRAEGLARDLAASATCHIHDLYTDTPPTSRPDLIVSDVEALTSDAVDRMRRILGAVRFKSVPYLFLVHGNAARAEAQAQALDASGTMARALALERHGLRGEGMALLERFVPRSVEEFRADPVAAHAIGQLRTFGQAPDAFPYRVLSRHLAQENDVPSAWRRLWKRCHSVRELGRRFSEKSSYSSSDPEDEFRQHDVPAVAPMVAAIGLGALDQLCAVTEGDPGDDQPGVASHVEHLWQMLYDAVVEQWMTDPIGRAYWESFLLLLATRRWQIARRSLHPRRSSDTLGESLETLFEPLIGLSRTFFSVLIALRRVGARTSDLAAAVAAAGGDVGELIDQAEELRSIDTRNLRFSDASWNEVRALRCELASHQDHGHQP